MKTITKKYKQYEITFDGKNLNKIIAFCKKWRNTKDWGDIGWDLRIRFDYSGVIYSIEIGSYTDYDWLRIDIGDTLVYNESTGHLSVLEKE